jgi:signal transduction histidine kinase/ligand-binding sensor domain-containing protein
MRYDGYHFRLYVHTPNKNSLNGSFITTLWVAPDGRLWIGTLSNGISVFDPKTELFKQYKHQPNNKNSIANNRIEAITGDKNGIWIGTNSGLDHLNLKTEKMSHFVKGNPSSINDNHIRSLTLDNSGTLWIGSWNGLNKFEPKTGVFESIHSHPKSKITLAKKNIRQILLDKRGYIWLATYANGTYRFSKKTDLEKISSSNAVTDIIQANDKEIWIATSNQGINIVNAITGKKIKTMSHIPAIDASLNSNDLAALLIDKSGLIWIASDGGGLEMFNPNNSAFRNLYHDPNRSNSLTNNTIFCITELKNGEVWICNNKQGIDIFDQTQGKIKNLDISNQKVGSPEDRIVDSIVQTTLGSIWVATQRPALFRYWPSTNKFIPYIHNEKLLNGQINTMLAEGDDNFLILSNQGVFRVTPKNNDILQFLDPNHLKKEYAQAFSTGAIQADGTIWLASLEGIFVIPPHSKYLYRIIAKPNEIAPFSQLLITDLLVDENDTLWVDTNKGLFKLDKRIGNSHAEFIQFNEIPATNGLLFDSKKNLWGPTKYVITNTKQYIPLGRPELAPIGRVYSGNSIRTKQNTLLFGGSKGILAIKPSLFKKWDYSPPIVLTEVKVDGISQPAINKIINLTPHNQTLSIEFSALDFTAPNLNKYAYKMQGFDVNWILTDSQHRIATYTNLAPGEYEFKVKGTNRHQEWNNKIITIKVNVAASWYQLLIFKIFFICSSILLLYGIYHFRVKQLENRKQELTDLIIKRTIDLENKTNEATEALEELVKTKDKLIESEKQASLGRMVRGIAHELNTPLSIIKMAFSIIKEDANEVITNTRLKPLGQSIANHKKQTLTSSCELLESNLERSIKLVDTFKKVSADEHCSLKKTIFLLPSLQNIVKKSSQENAQHQFDISINCAETIELHTSPDAIDQIISQLINNAITHGFKNQTDGFIKISVTEALIENKEYLKIKFEDNGKGITQENLQLIFDPFFTTDRSSGAIGLGLQIIFNIVTQKLNGTIKCQSSKNKGCRFELTFPKEIM